MILLFEEIDTEDKMELFLKLSSSIMGTESGAMFSIVDSLVDQFVSSSGYTINIDKAFILRFPLVDYHSLYRRMGINSRALTVSNVTQEEAITLIPLFRNIESLILEGLDIDEHNLIEYPAGVKFLKLSKCYYDGSEITENFDKMLCSLQSLHLDRFYCDNYEDNRADLFFPPELNLQNLICEEMDANLVATLLESCGNTLESLTVKNMSFIYVDNVLQKLTRLTIEDSGPYTDVSYIEAPALEHFSFRGVYLQQIPLHIRNDPPPVKSLEIVTVKPLRFVYDILRMKELQHVQIHCEWFDVVQLRSYFTSLQGLKSYDITSSSAPAIGYNLVNSLDAYSLRKIISYLSDDEMETLAKVHPKFGSLLPIVKINSYFLDAYPVTNSNLYQEILSQVRRLHLSHVATESFNLIMPHCTNLNALAITVYDDILFEIHLDLIPSIEELTLHVGSKTFAKISESRSQQWISLFRRLNGTLKRLKLCCERQSNTITACLGELKNLEEFEFLGSTIAAIDFSFLERNRNISILSIETKRHTAISYFRQLSLISMFYIAINVRSLHFKCCHFGEDLASIINRFENLEHLTLFHPFILPLSINGLTLNKLTSITVSNIDQTVSNTGNILELIRHFPNLKRIGLEFQDHEYCKRRWVPRLLDELNDDEGPNYISRFIGDNLLLTR